MSTISIVRPSTMTSLSFRSRWVIFAATAAFERLVLDRIV